VTAQLLQTVLATSNSIGQNYTIYRNE